MKNIVFNKSFDIIKITILIIIITFYYFITNKFYNTPLSEIEHMKSKINATYELIDQIDVFRKYQQQYNEEIIFYLTNINNLLILMNNDSIFNINNDSIFNNINKSTNNLKEIFDE